MSKRPPSGVLVVDKPAGPTSHDIVSWARRVIQSKAGHTGTLDPAATGVLPLVIGRATRLARFWQGSSKRYRATIQLGLVTDSYDLEGEVLETRTVPEISKEQLEETLSRFRGEIEQVPPLFSAIKFKGQPLYKAARSKTEIGPLPPRRVQIHSLELIEMQGESFILEVHCSAGTYIRALAHDIGQVLECGAVLKELRRTRSGEFSLEHAHPPDELEHRWQEHLIPMGSLLESLPKRELSPEEVERVQHGNLIGTSDQDHDGAWVRLVREDELIAMAEGKGATLQPRIVF